MKKLLLLIFIFSLIIVPAYAEDDLEPDAAADPEADESRFLEKDESDGVDIENDPVENGTSTPNVVNTFEVGIEQDAVLLIDMYTDELKNLISSTSTSIEVSTTSIARLESEKEEIINNINGHIAEARSSIRDAVASGNLEAVNTSKKKFIDSVNGELERLDDVAGEVGVSMKEVIKNEYLKRVSDSVDMLVLEITKKGQAIENRDGLTIYMDSDEDGVSDYDEEFIYTTDPLNADTDGDSVLDGEEILNMTNPKSAQTSAVVLESPKEKGKLHESLRITSIEVFGVEIVGGREEARGILFHGVALPNSYVTLFIFSDQLTHTIKTDRDGAWKYLVRDTISDGVHEAYITMADNTGRLLAKGQKVVFEKNGSNIKVEGARFIMSVKLFDARIMAGAVSLLALIGMAVYSIANRTRKKRMEATKKRKLTDIRDAENLSGDSVNGD